LGSTTVVIAVRDSCNISHRSRASTDMMINCDTCGAEEHQGCNDHNTELPEKGLHTMNYLDIRLQIYEKLAGDSNYFESF
jgi:hypothetical protein